MDDPGCRLYLITPPKIEPRAFADDLARTLDAGDVGCVQLRLKDADDDAIRRAADALRPVARARGVPLVISTDTHELDKLETIRIGLGVARRAWLEPRHVLNCLTRPQLLAWIHEQRSQRSRA